jgi:hypothetical protein
VATLDFKYGKGSIAIGSGSIDLLTASVQAMLVTASYAPQPNADAFVSSIPSEAIVIRDVVLTGKGLSPYGVFFGTVPPFNALISTDTVVAIILYVNSGSDATSQLLYYSSGGSGFPFLPQGFNYVVGYDQNNGGYFQV